MFTFTNKRVRLIKNILELLDLLKEQRSIIGWIVYPTENDKVPVVQNTAELANYFSSMKVLSLEKRGLSEVIRYEQYHQGIKTSTEVLTISQFLEKSTVADAIKAKLFYVLAR